MELPGVGIVFAQGLGKLVSAIQSRACAEIQVAMQVWIEDGIQGRLVRNADRPGRQPFLFVCIVGIFFFYVF